MKEDNVRGIDLMKEYIEQFIKSKLYCEHEFAWDSEKLYCTRCGVPKGNLDYLEYIKDIEAENKRLNKVMLGCMDCYKHVTSRKDSKYEIQRD